MTQQLTPAQQSVYDDIKQYLENRGDKAIIFIGTGKTYLTNYMKSTLDNYGYQVVCDVSDITDINFRFNNKKIYHLHTEPTNIDGIIIYNL